MLVGTSIVTPPTKDRYYLDFTTNGINGPIGGVTGSNGQFRCQIEQLVLDPDKKYTVEVVSFYYLNANVAAGAYPLVLSDIGENIRVVNTNSSLLFKSNQTLSDNLPKSQDQSNNAYFKIPVQKFVISEINFQIVRSDNGEEISLPNNIEITLLIKSVN